MVVHRQYHSKKYPNSPTARLLHLTNPPTTPKLYQDTNDCTWNNPMELDLLNVKKAPLMTNIDQNNFFKVSPCVRRLYTIFNSLCPNLYRIHCSDSLRTLQELIYLIEEYLHIHIPSTIKINELLNNEEYFDDFVHTLRISSFNTYHPKKHTQPKKPEIYCFGQGMHPYNDNNKLNQTILFCFELTTSFENNFLFPINIVILDPNENIVPNDIKYINTYDQGCTTLFSCSYKPTTEAGIYKISFFYNHVPLINSSFNVFIRNSTQSNEYASFNDTREMNLQATPQFELEGDGCSTKVVLNSIARFRLRLISSKNYYHKPTVDSFSVSILDPFGHTIVVQRRVLSSDLLELTYQPMSIGEHQLSISYNQKVQRQVIIDVINDETNYLSKLKPFGPGLQRAILGLPTEFYVDLSQEHVTNPTINHDHVQFCLEPSYNAEIDYEQQMATVRYTPLTFGDCPIHILESNKDVKHSPFVAHVKQENLSNGKPRLHITGLSEQIIIHRPVQFEVSIENSFNDPMHTLHVEIVTDDKTPVVSIERQQHSLFKCSFIPETLGRYIISIDYAGIVPENNPFFCQATQEKEIQLSGPAVNSQCLVLNEPTYFYFKVEDFLTKKSSEPSSTSYESGYSSNDDTSLNSSLTDGTKEKIEERDNYRVTITDGHGNIKQNVSVKNPNEILNENVRVDFTPDEQILFINISCTW